MYKSKLNPSFRSKFAEDIFHQKYAHEGCETWRDLAHTLVEDVCRDKMSREDKAQLAEYIDKMYFIPGGRYLYYAGRKKKFFNNCFRRNTRILTDDGWRRVEEEGAANVLSPVDGRFYPAEFRSRGVQEVFKYTFVPVRGKSLIEYYVYATRDHEWVLRTGEITDHLSTGDVVPASAFSFPYSSEGFAHGFIYGDGTHTGQVRVCGAKIEKVLHKLVEAGGSVSYPKSANDDPYVYFNYKDVKWKELPHDRSPEYIASFIEGWLAADSCQDRMLCSIDAAALRWFADNAAYAGIVVSGELRSQVRDVQLGKYTYKDHEIFIQNYSRGSKWAGFKCKSVVYVSEEEVFCPYEPVHNRIIIDHCIDTRNCFLLRSEEDTREDWAELSKKAELCLASGGGIGNDYSVYRPSGSVLGSTGGIASGPIPKMVMVDHIGSGIMQGGSRRSAIYASLNWRHGDIQNFLYLKDWDQPVGDTGLTMADIKKQDFNFKCPMDMTNISVNYDTDWLLNYWRTGNVGDVFKANVKQALKGAEPGFSFNFFEHELETLRNACTEVTSTDDSDVCNLGSINLGRIDDLATLASVVELATQFLICGTLVADLPYEKVREVRSKNRRLGLGLMGLHEWLIKRNHRYEVVPELHQWLSCYKGISDAVSRSFSDVIGVSRPVASRAIAPTGSIGILAGTTTGIEPVYAVAFKRRYLKGTRWHYQYVVDSASQEMIDLYGISPDNIESAIDLATDYERRIKFQADVQDYIDMAISSTINLPAWGSQTNNDDTVSDFTSVLARYSHRLRGFTCYPDGARGGQPLTSVSYSEAVAKLGEVFEEGVEALDVCDLTQRGGTCS